MKKTKIQAVISFVILNFFMNAQHSVGYAYDSNGNRTNRYFVGLRIANPNLDTQQDTAKLITQAQEIIMEKGVSVYPNPTKDLVMVKIATGDEKGSKNADMVLFDSMGKLIDRKKYSGTEISFDLSKNPPGNYYLRIVFEDQSKLNYNVIKVN